MYKRHLELYIDHCAEWWVLIPFEQQVMRHQFVCTPYIPDRIERGQTFEVHLQMHADLPGIEKVSEKPLSKFVTNFQIVLLLITPKHLSSLFWLLQAVRFRFMGSLS